MNDKVIEELLGDIEYLSGEVYSNNGDYGQEHLKWIQKTAAKNKLIHSERKNNLREIEKVSRPRGNVYFMDFGINIGSELNYPHFCVVLREFDYTAIVIPLTTEKEDDPEWKTVNNLITEIGSIKNLPEDKPFYALVNQMRAVSKSRLDIYKDHSGNCYSDLILDRDQMDLIEQKIITLCNNYTFEVQIVGNDYY